MLLGRFPFVRTGRSDLFVRKWYASVLRTVRTGSGQTGPAQGVGPISSHAPARVQRQMRGNFLAAGGKRGVSFGVQRKIQRWQNQTMTSLVSIYLGIVLPTFFLVNSELPSNKWKALLVCFFPPILAVRTRGSEEGGVGGGEMGRGKGHGSLANLYHTCKKVGHTIRFFLVI